MPHSEPVPARRAAGPRAAGRRRRPRRGHASSTTGRPRRRPRPSGSSNWRSTSGSTTRGRRPARRDTRGTTRGSARMAEALRRRGPDAAVEYFSAALYASAVWPEGFPARSRRRTTRRPGNWCWTGSCRGTTSSPETKPVRYLPGADQDKETPRPVTQRRALYREVLAQCMLLVLHELFAADEFGALESVALNGFVDDHDPATGRRGQIFLVDGDGPALHLRAICIWRRSSAGSCLATALRGQLSARPDQLARRTAGRRPEDVGNRRRRARRRGGAGPVRHGPDRLRGPRRRAVPRHGHAGGHHPALERRRRGRRRAGPDADPRRQDRRAGQALPEHGAAHRRTRPVRHRAVRRRQQGRPGDDVRLRPRFAHLRQRQAAGTRLGPRTGRPAAPARAARAGWATARAAAERGPPGRSAGCPRPGRPGIRARGRGLQRARHVVDGSVSPWTCARSSATATGCSATTTSSSSTTRGPRTAPSARFPPPHRTRPRSAVSSTRCPTRPTGSCSSPRSTRRPTRTPTCPAFTDAGIRLLDPDCAELGRLEVSDGRPGETALVLGSFRRRPSGDWDFVLGGKGYPGGLEELVRDFGIDVE